MTDPLWICLCFAVAACVTTVIDDAVVPGGPIEASAVVVPFDREGVEQGPLTDYYSSILGQMQDSMLERSLERILLLLAQHDRAVAPDWAREKMQRFRELAAVLEFELYLEENASLRIEVGPPAADAGSVATSTGVLGKPSLFVFELKSSPVSVRLAGLGESDGETKLRFSFVMTDTDCFANRTYREVSQTVALPKAVDFGKGQSLRLPFAFELEGGDGCRRTVRVKVQLMPGHVRIDGVEIPNRLLTCADESFVFYPPGIESVEKNPYATLSKALKRGDRLNHVFLAAHFITDDYRDDAARLLIEGVRNGRPAHARVAMAALDVLTGAGYSVDDRAAWLEWWQRRHSK